jgi:hypothetical protein
MATITAGVAGHALPSLAPTVDCRSADLLVAMVIDAGPILFTARWVRPRI